MVRPCRISGPSTRPRPSPSMRWCRPMAELVVAARETGGQGRSSPIGAMTWSESLPRRQGRSSSRRDAQGRGSRYERRSSQGRHVASRLRAKLIAARRATKGDAHIPSLRGHQAMRVNTCGVVACATASRVAPAETGHTGGGLEWHSTVVVEHGHRGFESWPAGSRVRSSVVTEASRCEQRC
jgi:hypothetical protein